MGQVARPCLGCGEPIVGPRCPDCSVLAPPRAWHPAVQNNARWKLLSKRLRRRSPFCETCGDTEHLTASHVIPIGGVGGDPSLAYDECNLRVECRPCNSARGTSAPSDLERQQVYDCIERRRNRPTTA